MYNNYFISFPNQIEKLLWVCPLVVTVYYALNIICIISHDDDLSLYLCV